MAETQQIEDPEPSEPIEDVPVEDVEIVDVVDGGEIEDATDAPVDEDSAALDELEAEELDMLTEDEAAETIVIDEAAELRAIRREQLELDKDPKGIAPGEFVCQSCFLVKRTSQLADSRKKICADCAS